MLGNKPTQCSLLVTAGTAVKVAIKQTNVGTIQTVRIIVMVAMATTTHLEEMVAPTPPPGVETIKVATDKPEIEIQIVGIETDKTMDKVKTETVEVQIMHETIVGMGIKIKIVGMVIRIDMEIKTTMAMKKWTKCIVNHALVNRMNE